MNATTVSNPTTDDPFSEGLSNYAKLISEGSIRIIDALEYCLARIDKYNDQLQAFEYLDVEGARKSAESLQNLLDSGTSLGPLMGVPIAVKDIIAVNGMPTTNGSLHKTRQPGSGEATVVERLRRAGCIIIGKTKTVEFALGATGINTARGTPHNPCDMAQHRLPGGSSSGSAVAVSAGFAAFALGTDTGGSVRIPASFNGLFGLKTSVGRWPTDGVFPLSPTLDSIGPLCRYADDALLVHKAICEKHTNTVSQCFETGEADNTNTGQSHPGDLRGVHLAIPRDLFFDELDTEVQQAFDQAVDCLVKAGATISDTTLPEAHERATLFPQIVPPELIYALGRDGFKQAEERMDPVTRERAVVGLDVDAVDYVAACKRHLELAAIAEQRFADVDGWITPTCPFLPMTLSSLDDPDAHQRSLLASRNTQPANLMKLCACTLPIHHLASSANSEKNRLPVGLQLMGRFGDDENLLHLGSRLEQVIGRVALPDLEQKV